MCESKKGMSANQLKRSLGCQHKTAWYLCHRIREAMGNDPFQGPTLFGVVEVDETLVGGRVKGRENAHSNTSIGWPARSSGAARCGSSASRTSGRTRFRDS